MAVQVCVPTASPSEDLAIGKEEETYVEDRKLRWGREVERKLQSRSGGDTEREGERQTGEERDDHSDLSKASEKDLEGVEFDKLLHEQKFVKALMSDPRPESCEQGGKHVDDFGGHFFVQAFIVFGF
jgi:hypothetical protein